jgi:hypothetical protein
LLLFEHRMRLTAGCLGGNGKYGSMSVNSGHHARRSGACTAIDCPGTGFNAEQGRAFVHRLHRFHRLRADYGVAPVGGATRGDFYVDTMFNFPVKRHSLPDMGFGA